MHTWTLYCLTHVQVYKCTSMARVLGNVLRILDKMYIHVNCRLGMYVHVHVYVHDVRIFETESYVYVYSPEKSPTHTTNTPCVLHCQWISREK